MGIQEAKIMKNCVAVEVFKIVSLEVHDFVVFVCWGCCLGCRCRGCNRYCIQVILQFLPIDGDLGFQDQSSDVCCRIVKIVQS